jgi:hypothetical protein
MVRARAIRWSAALGAAGLVWLGAQLPLWSMTMRAPQYPKGLVLRAYGTAMTGDLKEINILNHYIGMPPVEAPAFETALFPIGIAALVVLCLMSPLSRWLRRLAILATTMTPLVILADLQWRLYDFGHSLNPKAPIRLKPFTPLVIGETAMGNFISSAMVSWGFLCIVAAAGVLILGGWLIARLERGPTAIAAQRATAVAASVALLIAVPALHAAAQSPNRLQALIDAAPLGSAVAVPSGLYPGPVMVRGPLTVIGEPGATIDGGRPRQRRDDPGRRRGVSWLRGAEQRSRGHRGSSRHQGHRQSPSDRSERCA